MNYIINQKQLTCINILIRTLQEAINRECFDENEIQSILKTIKELNKQERRDSRDAQLEQN